MLKFLNQTKREELEKIANLSKGGPGSGRHAFGTGAVTYFKERLGVNRMKLTEDELKARLERKEAARKERWMPVFSKPKSIVIKTELGYRVVPKVEEK
jgi:hypothetical protein